MSTLADCSPLTAAPWVAACPLEGCSTNIQTYKTHTNCSTTVIFAMNKTHMESKGIVELRVIWWRWKLYIYYVFLALSEVVFVPRLSLEYWLNHTNYCIYKPSKNIHYSICRSHRYVMYLAKSYSDSVFCISRRCLFSLLQIIHCTMTIRQSSLLNFKNQFEKASKLVTQI